MDGLFSNIQKSLQGRGNKNTLLQNQQINQDKINKLLEQSAESLMCGPACQKIKITDGLKQKYLDAETNMQTAPIKLEQTKKNYYVYTEGRPFYDNMREEELQKKSNQIAALLTTNFNEEISNAETMNQILNTASINSDYTRELLNSYIEKNKELQLKLRDSHGDILTNDRKTYYETDAIDRLNNWHTFFWYIYYILYIVVLIATIIGPSNTFLSNLSIIPKVIVHIMLLTYPYYIDRIVMMLYGFIMTIRSYLPKNVYNNL